MKSLLINYCMFYSDKKYFNSLLKKKKMNIAITEHIQFLSKLKYVDSSKKKIYRDFKTIY